MDVGNRRRSSSFSPPPNNYLSIEKATASGKLNSGDNPSATLRSSAADLLRKPECCSSLLDFYEIERITGELERFIIRSAASKKDQAGERRRKVVGRAAADVRGLRRFFARQAVAFCGSDSTVVPERRCAAGAGGRPGA